MRLSNGCLVSVDLTIRNHIYFVVSSFFSIDFTFVHVLKVFVLYDFLLDLGAVLWHCLQPHEAGTWLPLCLLRHRTLTGTPVLPLLGQLLLRLGRIMHRRSTRLGVLILPTGIQFIFLLSSIKMRRLLNVTCCFSAALIALFLVLCI